MKIEANLLVGALALDLDFIVQEHLIEALAIWVGRKRIPLGDRLLERGSISADDKSLIDEIARRKLERYGGDARTCLAATASKASREAIRRVNDQEVLEVLEDIERSRTEFVGVGDSGGPASRFRRISVLNDEGGLGRIWLARDTDLKRDVAMKVIKPERALDPDSQRRMIAEARITGQFEHPNIVPVYEYGHLPEKREPFYVMKQLRGRTLGQEIARHHASQSATHESGNVNPESSDGRSYPQNDRRQDALGRRRLLEIFISVCNAVAFAHSRNVIHRDIKPPNIMIGEFGEVILLDWGLAKIVNSPSAGANHPRDGILDEKASRFRSHEEFMCSIPWCAPEQAEGRAESVDKTTDIYGLGATLFHILTGSPPYEGGTSQELIERIKIGETPRASTVVSNVPPRLDHICALAMSRSQHDRHPNALDLARDIRDWLDDEPVAAYRAAVNYFEKRLKENPHVRHDREGLASNRINLGLVFAGMSRYENAILSFECALAEYDELIRAYPAVPKYRADRAGCWIHLHDSFDAMGSNADANRALKAAKDDYHVLIKGNPTRHEYRDGWESVLISHGMSPEEVERRIGRGSESGPEIDDKFENDHADAARFYRELVENHSRHVASNPLDLGERETLARSLVKLGIVEAGLHRHLEAINNFETAHQHYNALIAAEPDNSRYLTGRAFSHSYIEDSRKALNQAAAAEESSRQASLDFGNLTFAEPYIRTSLLVAFALQMDVVVKAQLSAALLEWAGTPGRLLGDILLSRGAIDASGLERLQRIVELERRRDELLENVDSLAVLDPTRGLEKAKGTRDFNRPSTHIETFLRDPAEYDPFATLPPAAFAAVLERQNRIVEENRYQIVRPFSNGNLSDIYVAKDIHLNREVALKTIKPVHADRALILDRFILEAEITGGLQHPGIIPVYYLGAFENGEPFYVMPMVRGNSLADAIRQFHQEERQSRVHHGDLEFLMLLKRFANACHAVAYAHSRGVLHRDLKPQNIMLGRHGETLVIDWGLSKVLDRDNLATSEDLLIDTIDLKLAREEVEGSIIGTPAYMSPEQGRGILDALGPATDIYSLGATLFTLIVGTPPFNVSSLREILDLCTNQVRPRASSINPHTPPALDAICARAMAFNPEDRYQTVRDFVTDIDHWIANEPVSVYPGSLLRQVKDWVGRRKSNP